MNVISILIIILLLILICLFALRNKLLAFMSISLKIGFIIFLSTTLSALFFKKPYELIADFSLRQVGTRQTIQNIDNKLFLNNISDATKDFWGELKDFFAGNKESNQEAEDQIGFFEDALYPGLVSALGFLYRVLTIILSILGLIVIVYLSYTTAGVSDISELTREVEQLKRKVEKLQKNCY